MKSPSNLLDLQGVADRAGITYKTARNYHYVAETRRANGESRPGDMPPPDAKFGRSPAWSERTIDKWLTHRPGRGFGGGRPRKDQPNDRKSAARTRRRRSDR